jgi:hypothetical protein
MSVLDSRIYSVFLDVERVCYCCLLTALFLYVFKAGLLLSQSMLWYIHNQPLGHLIAKKKVFLICIGIQLRP